MLSVRACAAAKRRCRRRGAVETGGRNAILTHVDHLQIEQCCALVALCAGLFDLFDRHFRAVFVVPAQHVFAFEVVVGHRCGAAVGVRRNGADVKQRERVLIALELAKVMLVRARHRVYEALVREHKRRPAIVGVLAEPLGAGAKLAVVLLLVEFRAALAAQLHRAGEQIAATTARIFASRTNVDKIARSVPRVRVRAGLRLDAAEIFRERAEVADLQRAFARVVEQPALVGLAEFALDNDHATLGNRSRSEAAGIATTVGVVAQTHHKHVTDEKLTHRVRLEAWQARVALWRHAQTRGVVATAHIARIVLTRRETHAVTTDTRRAVAAAHVACIRAWALTHTTRIALRSTIRHTQTIGT